MRVNLTKNRPIDSGLKWPAARELHREKDFPEDMFDLERPELYVLIRDNLRSWALLN